MEGKKISREKNLIIWIWLVSRIVGTSLERWDSYRQDKKEEKKCLMEWWWCQIPNFLYVDKKNFSCRTRHHHLPLTPIFSPLILKQTVFSDFQIVVSTSFFFVRSTKSLCMVVFSCDLTRKHTQQFRLLFFQGARKEGRKSQHVIRNKGGIIRLERKIATDRLMTFTDFSCFTSHYVSQRRKETVCKYINQGNR